MSGNGFNSENKKARVVPFYLPQFHPIPENDEWWGKGFTEWTNSSKARSMFRGHYQPRIPADLGYYDLRLPETRAAQAEMAKKHGIEGFCYWHYWFGNGKRLIERPFNEVLKSGEPDFPFCLAWANQTWTGIWHGCPDRILIEQTYPGVADYTAHFYALLEAFRDPRYMTVDGKPVFLVFNPKFLPDAKAFVDCWQSLARREGLKGIYFIAHTKPELTPEDYGFDASVIDIMTYVFYGLRQGSRTFFDKVLGKFGVKQHKQWIRQALKRPEIYPYARSIEVAAGLTLRTDVTQFPSVFPNWDNTPRSSHRGVVLHDSSPELFKAHLRNAVEQVAGRDFDKRLVFVKSWNEWAEGNYLEPDTKFGAAYLEAVRDEVMKVNATGRKSLQAV